MLKWILERLDGMVWTGLVWFRIGTSRGLLRTRIWTFGFHKILGKSWVAAQLAVSKERLSPMKLVRQFIQSFAWREWENHENPETGELCLGRDSNKALLEYKLKVLLFEPICSVTIPLISVCPLSPAKLGWELTWWVWKATFTTTYCSPRKLEHYDPSYGCRAIQTSVKERAINANLLSTSNAGETVNLYLIQWQICASSSKQRHKLNVVRHSCWFLALLKHIQSESFHSKPVWKNSQAQYNYPHYLVSLYVSIF
jgi:hypothetical protein